MTRLIELPSSAKRSTANLRDQQRAALERRLEDGYLRIEEALAAGQDVSAWETFWIQLLREYESICDDLAQAA